MMQACLHPLTLQTAFGHAAGRLYLPQYLNVNLPRFIVEQSLNLAHRVQMQQEAERRRLIEEAQEPTVYIDRNAVTLRIPRSVVNPYQSAGDMEGVLYDNCSTGDNIYSGTRSVFPEGINIESKEGSCLQQSKVNEWHDGTSTRQSPGPKAHFASERGKITTTAAQHIVEQGTYKKGGTGIHNVAGGDIINVPTVVHDTEHSKDTKRVSLINNPCVSESGGDITNDAEGHITLQSTQAKAVGDYRADAGTGVSMPAARDIEHVEATSRSKGSLGGTKTRHEVTHSETNKVANINVGGKIKLGTKEGNITTETPVLKAGQGISFSSPAGKLILKAVRDTYFHSVQKSSSNMAWQSFSNEGESRSTVRQGVYDPGEGEITIDAPEVSVEKRAEDLHTLDALFKALKDHDNVTWHGLEDTYEAWHEEHHSLSPALGVVIGIAVGMLTAGTGAGATVAGLAKVGETAAAFISGAVNAGISSLASQASISMINNQGDIGAVLKDLSSKKSLKSLVTTMATAGLTKVACQELKINLGSAKNPQSFVDRAKENLVRAGVNIPLESMMNGQDFGQTLESNLRSGIANTLAGHAAAKIGVAYHSSDASGPQLDEVSHKLLHALVGAGMAAITKGDILAGSVGAVIGEMTAAKYRESLGDEYDPSKDNFETLKERGVQLARLSAAFAAFLTGRDPNDAAMTAGNAARENAMQVTFEQHLEERQAKAPATEEEEEDPVTSKKDKGKEKADDQDDAEAEGVEDEGLGLKAAIAHSRITYALEEEAGQQQGEDEEGRIGILEDIFTPRTEAEWAAFRQARAELEENDPVTSKRDKGKARIYDHDEEARQRQADEWDTKPSLHDAAIFGANAENNQALSRTLNNRAMSYFDKVLTTISPGQGTEKYEQDIKYFFTLTLNNIKAAPEYIQYCRNEGREAGELLANQISNNIMLRSFFGGTGDALGGTCGSVLVAASALQGKAIGKVPKAYKKFNTSPTSKSLLPGEGNHWVKLKGNQGWKNIIDKTIWKKDMLHKDHWDVSNMKGKKIKEVDFDGNQIWPDGPKNKNK